MVVESLAPLITPCSTSPKSLKTDMMMMIVKMMMLMIVKMMMLMIVKTNKVMIGKMDVSGGKVT